MNVNVTPVERRNIPVGTLVRIKELSSYESGKETSTNPETQPSSPVDESSQNCSAFFENLVEWMKTLGEVAAEEKECTTLIFMMFFFSGNVSIFF
jgi:hypothetical protein